ncbi:hypothetical protein DY000_02015092 [Brassica cretica]|uniref:Uncharacterized protein n=1 Tax=Brassica cretica TaxID=69181 RepID=A0ABQ7DDE7_BRACR|nr:hypothetical protein DY000_02015092 [Brassica cretica]
MRADRCCWVANGLLSVANGLKPRRVTNGSKQLSGRERAGYRTVSGRVEHAEIVSREHVEAASWRTDRGRVLRSGTP